MTLLRRIRCILRILLTDNQWENGDSDCVVEFMDTE